MKFGVFWEKFMKGEIIIFKIFQENFKNCIEILQETKTIENQCEDENQPCGVEEKTWNRHKTSSSEENMLETLEAKITRKKIGATKLSTLDKEK